MSKIANELANRLPQMGPSTQVTPEEKRALYTGQHNIEMRDTAIVENMVTLCCMEMFISKKWCAEGEQLVCPVCGKVWALDGLTWRVMG